MATRGKPPTDLDSLGWIQQLDFYKTKNDQRTWWEYAVINNNTFPGALSCLPAQAIQRPAEYQSQQFY